MANIKPKPYRHKNGWRVSFCLFGEKYSKYVGQSKKHAYILQSQINHIILQLRRGYMDIPQNCTDLGEFVFSQVIRKPSRPQFLPKKENGILVSEFISEYISEIYTELNNSAKTEIIHLNHLQKFVRNQPKNITIGNIDIDFFHKYKKYRKSKDVCAKTINKEITTFRKIFQYAVERKYLNQNVLKQIKNEKEKDSKHVFRTTSHIKELLARGNYSDKEIKNIRRYRYLDSTEINDFIKHAEQRMGENHWITSLVIALADTGMRRSEVISLTWLNIDFEKNILYAHSNKQSAKKLSVRRAVYMSRRLRTTLEMRKSKSKEPWVFPGANGKQLSVNTLRSTFLTLLKGTDYEGIGFHCFRHSFISIMAAKGIDKQTIGNIVGHTSQEMTDHYTHLFPSIIKEAFEKVFDEF